MMYKIFIVVVLVIFVVGVVFVEIYFGVYDVYVIILCFGVLIVVIFMELYNYGDVDEWLIVVCIDVV